MLPIGDDNSLVQRTGIVTWALVIANVLVFVLELTQGRGLDRFLTTWGAIPAEITSGQDLYTLVTSMFLHGGYGHIIGNMLFLKVFGDNVEDVFGHGMFLLFYLVCGLAASAAHVLLNSGSSIPMVGASGAISGVLGAYIIMFRSNRVNVLLGFFVTSVPAWMMIGFWAFQQFVNTWASLAPTAQTGGVAYAAHAGGFLAGALLALILIGLGRVERRV